MSLSSSLSSVEAVRADGLLVRDAERHYRPACADEVLQQARRVLSQRVRRGATMSSPQAVKDHLSLHLGVLEHEVFCVLFLDAQHRIIELRQMPRYGCAKSRAPMCSATTACARARRRRRNHERGDRRAPEGAQAARHGRKLA